MINADIHFYDRDKVEIDGGTTMSGDDYVVLKIKQHGGQLSIFFKSNDDLSLLSDAIHEHFARTGYNHHPDEQRVLNAELDDIKVGGTI